MKLYELELDQQFNAKVISEINEEYLSRSSSRAWFAALVKSAVMRFRFGQGIEIVDCQTKKMVSYKPLKSAITTFPARLCRVYFALLVGLEYNFLNRAGSTDSLGNWSMSLKMFEGSRDR